MTDLPTIDAPLSVLQHATGKADGFKPPAVERSDLHSRVLKRLRLAILTGELQPGARIQQAALARAFGVSTSPLREAIRDLISAGLLDLEVYAGATVHVPSPSELNVVGEMRVALMPVTVACAIERITDDELAHAEDLVDELQRTRPKAEWVELNREFHSLLDGACREPVLASSMQRLDDLMSLYVNMDPASDYDRMYRSKRNDEHAEIVQAYRDRDLERAVTLNVEHVRRTVAGVLQVSGLGNGTGNGAVAEPAPADEAS